MIARISLLVLFVLGGAAACAGSDGSLITAVHSRTVDGYVRPRDADGAFKRETYALSNGGPVPGTLQDNAMDKVPFASLADALVRQLAEQDYHLARNAKSADLLLLVQWGATTSSHEANFRAALNEAPSSPAAAQLLPMLQRMRDRATLENARVLGYYEELQDASVLEDVPGANLRYRDLRSDVEEPRYYLIVSAYDFREMVERKIKKLRWITRVSIRAPGNSFAAEFDRMLADAAPHFGQDTGRLLRRDEVRERVDIGELEVLGESPPTSKGPR